MEEEEISTSSCSCSDNSEKDTSASDNDLNDGVVEIKRRKTDGNCCISSSSTTFLCKSSSTVIGSTHSEENVRKKTTIHTTSTHKSSNTVMFNRSLSSEGNIRTILPYPCNLGSFKVRSQIMHKDFLFRPGDIISVREADDRKYFAQIKLLIENKFCERYAAFIWLIPNTKEFVQNTPFNPDWFIYGPEDETFYPMDAVTFVMHAPTAYYKRLIPPVPESSNLIRPHEAPKKRRKCKSKREGFRLPASIL